MKVLIFSHAPSVTNPNTASFIINRIENLQKLNCEVCVLQYGNLFIGNSKVSGNFREKLYKYLQFIKKLFHKKNIKYSFKNENISYEYYDSLFFLTFSCFSKWFKKNHFDFIHAHFLWNATLLPQIKKKCNIPYIVTAHGSDIHTDPFSSVVKRRKCLEILNDANFCFFVSKYLLTKAKELGYKKDNFFICGNGYNAKYFFIKDRKKIDKNNLILGYIGNPIAIKGFMYLPDILAGVAKKYPNVKLYCVGSTNEAEDLRIEMKNKLISLGIENNCIFIDKVPYKEVADFIRKIDIMLVPSIREGFSCLALESQACGVPVIGSSNGGIPEATGNIGLCVNYDEHFVENIISTVFMYIDKPFSSEYIALQSKGKDWLSIVRNEVEIYKKIIMK